MAIFILKEVTCRLISIKTEDDVKGCEILISCPTNLYVGSWTVCVVCDSLLYLFSS